MTMSMKVAQSTTMLSIWRRQSSQSLSTYEFLIASHGSHAVGPASDAAKNTQLIIYMRTHMIARTTVKPRIAVHKKMIGHTLMRESVPCTLFMYRGNYSDRQFAAALPLLALRMSITMVARSEEVPGEARRNQAEPG